MVYVSIVCVRISEELYSPSIGEELADDGKPRASHSCGPGSFSSVLTPAADKGHAECYSLTTSHVVCAMYVVCMQ